MTQGDAIGAADAAEAVRFDALRRLEIVGTGSEAHFDAVCSLAQAFFKVPTVLVSFIEDNDQWFKARCGFEPECTSRTVSFCNFAIASDDVMVVPDATRDARFKFNSLVTGEPFIRFYAGAPLILAPGIRVGTICVIDVVPRDFSPEDCRKLEEFATIVIALLRLQEGNVRQRNELFERAGTEDRLRAGKAFQDKAGRIAGIGAWELDLVSKLVTVSDETRRIHDIDGPRAISYDEAMAFYPLATRRGIEDSIKAGKPWDLELPLVTAKGRSVRVRTAGEAEFVDGRPVRLTGVFQDVTGRYNAEHKIREQEAQYRLLAENASDMIVRIDLSGTRLFVSPSSQDLIGYTPDELVGTRPSDSIHPDDLPRFEAMRAGLIDGTRELDSVTNRLRHKNGTYVWVEAKWRVLRDAEGHAVEFIATVRDIGARREAEERLKASEALYRTLADSLPQMVWIVSAGNRTCLYGNHRYHTYYGEIGTGRDERVGRNHPDDRNRMEDAWARSSAEGRALEIEGRLGRHDGVYRWHKIIATPVWRDGAIIEWLGTALDIDDIVVDRQKLRETSDLLSLSQEAAGAGIFDLDLVNGRVVLSRESLAMHGLADDKITEIDLAQWRACVDPDDGPRILTLVDEACERKMTYSAEFRVPLSGGRVRWIHGIGRAHYDLSGRPVRMIGLNFDITERKAAEATLIKAIAAAEAATREAEQASAAKSDFLASMSHEIRTPLNSIIGYTDLLIENARDEAADRRKLDLIRDSGSALLTIVNDILDFSKIEAGEIDLDPVPFSPKALVDNVLGIVAGFAGARHLTIERDLAADLPGSICGDVGRLRQILLNLLNNAVKFTSEGAVKLIVLRETSRSGICRLRFIVEDTGIGIPIDRRERLFQRFSQIDGSIARRFGGTGLGLAISKSLVERMGGRIGVESVEGIGSSFWFTVALPIVAAVAPVVEAAANPGSPAISAHILLVDDVVVNQELVRAILESGGHSVELASDGVEAIQMVQDGHFDLVLMDVQMPGMDGVTATRRIRDLAKPCRSIPIVAMTANVMPDQVARFKAAGMNDHVGKPFERIELFATVKRWAEHQALQAAGHTSSADRPGALDRAVFDELRGLLGDSICKSLVDKFSAELTIRFAAEGDRARIAADAHALCSSAGSLGFKRFSDLCREVESTVRQGGDLSAGFAAIERARTEIQGEVAGLTF